MKKEERVNVYNEKEMIKLGLRCPLEPLDRSAWEKTDYERKMLKKFRHKFKGDGHFHNIPEKHIPVRCKLIIYLRKNKKFDRSVISTTCWQNEIPRIISSYRVRSKSGEFNSVVIKYSWNGKTYKPNEVPAW